MNIAYITAGAAGMYCGSCMHDNTLARALMRVGVDVQLIPLYTPIRTDETDVSVERIFFGGINVYLQQKIPLFRHLPAFVDRFFDQVWLLNWATSRAIETDVKELGGLTVSMLRGASGYQRKEVRKLCDWLAASVKPNLVNLSNMLVAGCVPELKQRLGVPVLVTLQGDDIFLDGLVEPHKSRALAEIQKLAESVDGFITHSKYYADYMAAYLGVPREKFHITPLGIDVEDFLVDVPAPGAPRDPTIGYLARLAPEKGLHVLVEAFIELRKRPGQERTKLKIAGWLGGKDRTYAEEQWQKLQGAGLADAFEYAGSVDRAAKVAFLRGLDILCVPTVYREPKGLFVLEALAAGVPVVVPEHGAFPELLAATGGGRLAPPNDSAKLADVLAELLADDAARQELAARGLRTVRERFNSTEMAKNTLAVFDKLLATPLQV
jgi:glycosyltransferase involved in cell wall biosynthesis